MARQSTVCSGMNRWTGAKFASAAKPEAPRIFQAAFCLNSMHQPFGLTEPTTTRHPEGDTKFEQTLQRCSPFGCA
jgi:hypothetical protein